MEKNYRINLRENILILTKRQKKSKIMKISKKELKEVFVLWEKNLRYEPRNFIPEKECRQIPLEENSEMTLDTFLNYLEKVKEKK
jgi:hypothetical protein